MAHLDHDLLLKTLEECKQAAFGKQMVLAVHQFGYFRLVDIEESCDFPLFQFPRLQDQADGMTKLRAGQKLVGVVKLKVGKDIAATDFIIGFFLPAQDSFSIFKACL